MMPFNETNNHRAPDLWYGTPLWAVGALLIVCLCLSVLFGVAGCKYNIWAPNGPVAFRYFFYLLGFVFAAVVLRPRNWQRWTYFVASRDGLHFPTEVPESRTSAWLTVPWSRVGEIKLSRFAGNKKGPSIEILISDEEKCKYFPHKRIMEQIFGNPASRPEFTVIGYSNVFINDKRAVESLNRL